MGYHTHSSKWMNHTVLGVIAGKLWLRDLADNLHLAIICGKKRVARQALWWKSLKASSKIRMPTKGWNEKANNVLHSSHPKQTNRKNTRSDLGIHEGRRSFFKKSIADADGDPVQGMERIIFMRLSIECQILKDKASQHAGPPRATSEWS